MMIKKKSNPWARLKYLYILPLAAASVAAFARPEVSNELTEISSVKVSDLTSVVKGIEVKSVEKSSSVKVAGKVVMEQNGKPLSGVSVIVRGTTNGTLADAKGKFSLMANEGDVLMFSFVGMQTQSVIVPKDGSESMVVSMKEEVQNLNEMVVVGYAPQDDGVIQVTSAKKEEETPAPKADEEQAIFQVVEEMPSFPGGMNECMKFLAKNMKYPVAAQQAKVEGRVIVQFVVDKDGTITDTKVVRGVSPEIDAEALRVVGMMPKWNPGKQRGKAVAVKYTLPMMFRLQKQEPKNESSVVSVVGIKADKDVPMGTINAVKQHIREGGVTRVNYEVNRDTTSKSVRVDLRGSTMVVKPLVIVDGVEKGYSTDVWSMINPREIESITVLKDQNAIAKYGEKGKDGVIVIETKKTK
jgi:TonB family protein